MTNESEQREYEVCVGNLASLPAQLRSVACSGACSTTLFHASTGTGFAEVRPSHTFENHSPSIEIVVCLQLTDAPQHQGRTLPASLSCSHHVVQRQYSAAGWRRLPTTNNSQTQMMQSFRPLAPGVTVILANVSYPIPQL